MIKKLDTLSDLYQYFDGLFEQNVDSDILFASGYLRGVISSIAADSGDEQQVLSTLLIDKISIKLHEVKTELSPQDNAIVQNFWVDLQKLCKCY